MEPEIVEKEALNVIGITVHGSPGSFDYSCIWDQFMSRYFDQIKQFSIEDAYYNLYFGEQGTEVVDLVAGMAVTGVIDVPDGLVLREIPSARYAVFEGQMDIISQTWNYIYEEWLPASEYEHDDKDYDFEYFPSDSSGSSSPVYIHIPIKSK